MSKMIVVSGSFRMSFKHEVQVEDDFDVTDDTMGEYLKDRMDNADFTEIANANGGGEWEVEDWCEAPNEA